MLSGLLAAVVSGSGLTERNGALCRITPPPHPSIHTTNEMAASKVLLSRTFEPLRFSLRPFVCVQTSQVYSHSPFPYGCGDLEFKGSATTSPTHTSPLHRWPASSLAAEHADSTGVLWTYQAMSHRKQTGNGLGCPVDTRNCLVSITPRNWFRTSRKWLREPIGAASAAACVAREFSAPD